MRIKLGNAVICICLLFSILCSCGVQDDANESLASQDLTPAVVQQQTQEDIGQYVQIIEDNFVGFDGTLSYSLHIYDKGQSAVNEHKSMKSASVIKLFIMEYTYDCISRGELKETDTIGGVTVKSLIESMITVSDNTSTNVLIQHFTMDKLNAFFKACGYKETKLQRRMLDTAAASRGEENYTSAADVTAFLDKLYTNQTTYPYNEMLAVMQRQQISTKLRRNMPYGVRMASKTGELDDTENDVAIVFTPNGDYALVCLTGGGASYEARNAMAQACRGIYDALQTETDEEPEDKKD